MWGPPRDINSTQVRNDCFPGCFGFFVEPVKQLLRCTSLPDAVEIHLNILSAFPVHLLGLMNCHLIDELIEDLLGKLADVRILLY